MVEIRNVEAALNTIMKVELIKKERRLKKEDVPSPLTDEMLERCLIEALTTINAETNWCKGKTVKDISDKWYSV